MRTIGVVTVGRSDYGLYRPILKRIMDEPAMELRLIVAGMHLSPEFGLTVREIEAEGMPIAERIDMLVAADTPGAIAKSMGLGTLGFAQAFARRRPDILLLLGDRFEMHAAAVAAVPFTIPLAHIHGGEITEGATDNAWRQSITMLGHLHFVSTDEARRRLEQMGEEPWRVIVSGAPGLDNLKTMRLLERPELAARIGLSWDPPPLVVTSHPVTLEYERTEWQIGELLAALDTVGHPVVFTAPNADTNGRVIRRAIEAFVARHATTRLVEHLGTQVYFSLMAHAGAMAGNSSSGLIEAPSFELPTVNIGTRQEGRLRAANVIDVGYRREEIRAAIRQALDPSFRRRLRGMVNPYGDGRATERIVRRLKEVPLDQRLISKRFVDLALLTPQVPVGSPA